jgi:hypothetical protein
MNKSIILALALIAVVVFVLLNNHGSVTIVLLDPITVRLQESIAYLGFFIVGIVAGVLLKSS